MGLLIDKGHPVYEEPQIMSCRKRMETVQKKIKTPAKAPKKKAITRAKK